MKPFCTINGIPVPDMSAAFHSGFDPILNESQLKEMRVRMGEQPKECEHTQVEFNKELQSWICSDCGQVILQVGKGK